MDELDIIIADTIYPDYHRRAAYQYKGECYDRLDVVDSANIVYYDLIQSFPDAKHDIMYAEWRLQYNSCLTIDSTFGSVYDSCMREYMNRVIDDITKFDTSGGYQKRSSEDKWFEELSESYEGEEELAIQLDQNAPNPFASLTEIQYFLSKRERAKLTLMDINGRIVADLINRYVPGGWSSLIVNGSGLAPGVYILMLEGGGKAVIKKINKSD